MAVYPAGNPGVAPLDPTSDVGQVRLAIGDTQSTPYDPDEPGFGDYVMFSDAELALFFARGGTVLSGAGFAYLALAAQAALASQSVKDYDLALDNTKRAADLRAIAQAFFDQDIAGGAGEYFDIVPTGRRSEWAELAERPYGWC